MTVSNRIVIAFVAVICFTSCGKTGDEEIYILPNHYQGAVFILFNQKDGEPEKLLDGTRVYEIPSNGVLRTKFSPNKGWHKLNKYYYSNAGQRKEIPYEIDNNVPDSLAIRICCQSAGNAKINPESSNPVSVDYSLFIVASKSNIDSIAEEAQKINAASLLMKN